MTIVGLGQRAAGDDAVGLAVLAALRDAGLAVTELDDPSALVGLLDVGDVVLVDAIVAPPAGRVIEPSASELARGRAPTSSHGVSVADALALAEVLVPGALARLRIVAVTIDRPPRAPAIGLSPAVGAAVPHAAARVRALAAGLR